MERPLSMLPVMPGVVLALGRARLALRTLDTREIPRMNERARRAARGSERNGGHETGLVDTIAYLAPRISRRLPWRADCLVQAMAAQRWLMERGVPSSIVIGADIDSTSGFSAHAWLLHGERVVTGGDVARYVPILGGEGTTAF